MRLHFNPPLNPATATTDTEPRWPAVLAGLATGGLYTALPMRLVLGPRGFLLVVICVFLVPLVLTHWRGHHNLNQALGYVLSGVLTVFLVTSVGMLVLTLPRESMHPLLLLRAAASLWVTNVLVFASWYWRLDAGGPHARDMEIGHRNGAFLFPQMTLDNQMCEQTGSLHWSPQFTDYLFLAFNASTALSPADTAVLSRWAKLLMMVQSLLSLTIIALLAARAVNIL